MSDLIYFVPNTKSLNIERAEELGIGHAFEKPCNYREVPNGKGPEGAHGIVCGRREVMNLAYRSDSSQKWKQRPNSDIWVGFDTSTPPTPAGMARSELLDGHPLEVNGQTWIVPMARRMLQGEILPRVMEYDGENWRPGEVIGRYRRLWEVGQICYDAYTSGDDEGKFEIPEHPYDLAADALAANYHVDRFDAGFAGMIPSRVWEILRLVIDEVGLIKLLDEKKTAESSTLPLGTGGETQATDPPLQTSTS